MSVQTLNTLISHHYRAYISSMRQAGESALRYLAKHPPRKGKKVKHTVPLGVNAHEHPVQEKRQATQEIARDTVKNLEHELVAEKHRSEEAEERNWAISVQRTREREAKRLFPRSLEHGTFFTPHLHKRRGLGLEDNSGVEREWCVVLPNLNVTRSPYNPVRIRSRNPVADPRYRSVVTRLESEGWDFIGTNNDIYIFERQFNGRADGQLWARKTAFTLTGSVASLLSLLYAGEWFLSKMQRDSPFENPSPHESNP